MSNSTTSPSHNDHVSRYILLFLCSVAILENLFVCFMILNYRRLRTTTNIFIFGLCTTNVLCAGVLLPTHSLIPDSLPDKFLTIIVILTYISNLTAVTFERYIAISRPLRYHQIITKRRAIRIVIFCYIAPLAYCVLPFAWEVNVHTVVHKVYVSFTLALFLVTPLIFILGVYAKVCHATHKFFKKHSKLIVTLENNSGSELWEEAKFLCCLHKSKLRDDDESDGDDDDQLDEVLSSSDKGSPILQNNLKEQEDEGKHISAPCNQNGFHHNTSSKSSDATNISRENMNGNGNASSPIGYTFSDLADIYEHEPEKNMFDNKRRKISKQRSLSYLQRNNSNNRKKTLPTTRSNDTIIVRKKSSIRRNEYVVKKYPLQSSLSFENTTMLPQKKLSRHDSVLSQMRQKQNYYQKRRSSTLRMSSRSWISFNNKAKQMLTEIKASLAFALVALTYMFTWLPVVYMSVLDVTGKLELVPPTLAVLSTYTIGLNAMLDPLLYGIMLKEFRYTIKTIIRKRNIEL